MSKGDNLALHVIAKGPGSVNFTYQWRKVDNDSFPSTTEGENTQNLMIRSVMPSDSGSYYCIVMNQWGEIIESKIIIVNVLCKLIYISIAYYFTNNVIEYIYIYCRILLYVNR